MTNQTFLLLTDAQRKEKFSKVLKLKSEGRLTGTEIKHMLRFLPVNIQFEVMIYDSPEDFSKGIGQTGGYRKRMVLGAEYIFRQDGQTGLSDDHAAAITTRKKVDGEVTNQLHIYIPKKRHRRRRRAGL